MRGASVSSQIARLLLASIALLALLLAASVQGGTPPASSHERISIALDGGMEVVGDEMLHVTFDDFGRAQAYVRSNRPGAEIIAFDVDPEFVNAVRQAAVPQAQGRSFPNMPQIADPSKTSSSFGLPADWIDQPIGAAIRGTGRMVE